jgi:signal transduction histidine kinase
MFTLLVVLAVSLQIAIALGVYFRRRGGHNNTIFMYLTLALASWALANYVAISMPQNQSTLYAIRIVIGLVVIQNTLFYFFAKAFPDKQISKVRYARAVLYYSVLLLILTQTPLLFQSVTIRGGTANPNPGPVILFFVIHAVFTIASGLRSLFQRYKSSAGQPKRQLLLVIFASTVLWLIVPITNFAITLTAQTTVFVRFSPFYTLLFGAFITYAIVAQKLFDIRAAVARSVGYVLVLGAAALIYSVIFFGVINVAFPGTQHEFLRQLLAIFLVAPLALAFQSLKRFFDRWTNQLFYRESYDSQEVLDKMGNIVVAEIELYRILNHTRSVLSEALKSSFIEFVILKNGKPHIEAHLSRTIDQSTLALGTDIVHQKPEILMADDLNSQTGLPHRLSEANAALSLRLKTQEQIVGYVIFGDKKSGDVYTAQDRKLLLILASELAIAVQNALRFEEIQNFNLTLQAKVDEATRKLRKANDKLRQMDETKDDFISMASHQLRTPLTSVKGYTSMVLEGDAGKLTEGQKKLLNQSFFSAQRMVYLIADLLNVSRLKTGKFVVDATPVNLAEVVAEEVEQLKETAASRSLTLSYDKPKKFSEVMLDDTKTRQVIMNFIDNAIYYTPAGGHIGVKLAETPTTIELRVEDDGIGVPKHEQPHLFTKFYRAGNARHARPDGTGLGLFMAKKVIVSQGGALIFESQEGKGSTFGFIFSKRRLAANAKKPDKPVPKKEPRKEPVEA